jgi:poly-beta-1,6-N-acetyl-D-glucosamine N-deacetylase
VVFQDDGYLNDFEDFHPDALPFYAQATGADPQLPSDLSEEQRDAWTDLKTDTLIALTQELAAVVRTHRPEARFARTVYAPVLTDPGSEEWFAQNYAKSLDAYDYVVVMAYPKMEKVRHIRRWLRRLVWIAQQPEGIAKTVFKVQTRDWKRERWIHTVTVHRWLHWLVAAGAHHVGYYPDSVLEDQPRQQQIRQMMSVEDFPFHRR